MNVKADGTYSYNSCLTHSYSLCNETIELAFLYRVSCIIAHVERMRIRL
jgi:hypothetical protein